MGGTPAWLFTFPKPPYVARALKTSETARPHDGSWAAYSYRFDGAALGSPAPILWCSSPHTSLSSRRLGEEVIDTALELWAGHEIVFERCQLPHQVVHPPRQVPASSSCAKSAW
jgi:hypothetical protein